MIFNLRNQKLILTRTQKNQDPEKDKSKKEQSTKQHISQ